MRSGFSRRRDRSSFGVNFVQDQLKRPRGGADSSTQPDVSEDLVDSPFQNQSESASDEDDDGEFDVDEASLQNLLLCLDNSNPEPREDMSSSDDEQVPLEQGSVFSSLSFYEQGRDYDRVVDQAKQTRTRRVTRTVYGQMLLREQHGLSKDFIRDQNIWIQMDGFHREHVREYDMLRIRRAQLLPLVPLFSSTLPILKSYTKRMKAMGLTVQPKSFELPWRCPLDASLRELALPGRLEHHMQNGHAVVEPVATSFRNGRGYRENPGFTFDGFQGEHEFFRLGTDVAIEARAGHERLAKIIAVFMHTGPQPAQTAADAPAIAVYVLFYCLLQDYQSTSRDEKKSFDHAKGQSIGECELVLCEQEVLLKGQALLCIKRTIKVVATEQELSSSSSSSSSVDAKSYLCRFAVDGQVHCRTRCIITNTSLFWCHM
jgi:hypothetical protein